MLYTVISAGRPGNVPKMQTFLPPDAVWLVPEGEGGEYRLYGAKVIEVESTQITHQLNAALEMATEGADKAVVLCDDDLRNLRLLHADKSLTPIGIKAAAELILRQMENVGAYYGGINPTGNAYFVHKALQTNKYIRNSLSVVRPEPGMRFDNGCLFKSDYDFTCQQLTQHGCVARVEVLLATFPYAAGRGGCQRYRTPEGMASAVEYLKGKWPDVIVDNPKRVNEVLLKWKAPAPA